MPCLTKVVKGTSDGFTAVIGAIVVSVEWLLETFDALALECGPYWPPDGHLFIINSECVQKGEWMSQ